MKEGTLISAFLKQERGLKQFSEDNHIEDGWITLEFRDCKSTYEIDLARISTPKELLAWTLHLGDKNWINMERLLGIIKLISDHKGWELHTY